MNHIFQKTKQTVARISWRGESGQALIEFAVASVMLIVLIFGVIDFCRAIYLRQVLVNLSRETANLEARGSGTTTMDIMTNALNAAITEALPLALNSSTGMVIVTAVTNFNSKGTAQYTISQQYTAGSLAGAIEPDRIKHKRWQQGDAANHGRYVPAGESHCLRGRDLL